ncbi:DUF4386 domain-containing protein [Nocardia sp. NPDC005825]|uniref:DUF4386 domain-containing protein n=1 Tax=unclassified Nocardia TaxID=2637762 RepID=UPI0033F9ACF7
MRPAARPVAPAAGLPSENPPARPAGRSDRWAVRLLIVAAVVGMNAGFSGLGSAFDYPRVLSRPSAEVLGLFRVHESAVVAWFSVLVCGALLLIPIAVLVGRSDRSVRMRWAVRAGVAAGVVQATGLLRWPLLVPGFADRAESEVGSSSATADFELWNRILGSFVGETLGYTLTAIWTVLVASVLRRRGFPRWFAVLGTMAAALILLGVAAPWQVPGTQQANFAGYVLWSGWMLALAVLWGRRRG